MPLGREVDDEPRSVESAGLPDVHLAEPDLAGLTCFGVRGEHLGIRAAELQRNALAHHPDGIDGVDERIDVREQVVTCCSGQHRGLHGLKVRAGYDIDRWLITL